MSTISFVVEDLVTICYDRARRNQSTPPPSLVGAASLTLGITSTSGYSLIPLTTADAQVPGEYADAAGCFNFPAAPDNAGPFCCNMLFDIGIENMYLGLDDFQRPTGYNTGGVVTTGDAVNIIGRSPSSPAMCYSFTSGGD